MTMPFGEISKIFDNKKPYIKYIYGFPMLVNSNYCRYINQLSIQDIYRLNYEYYLKKQNKKRRKIKKEEKNI